jgi:hypothetical protein
LSTLIDFPFVITLLIKLLIVTVFPILLYTFGFFEEEEIRRLRKIWTVVVSSRGKPKLLLDSFRQTFLTDESVNPK